MQQGVMQLFTIFTFLRTSANVSRKLRSETVETQLVSLSKCPTLLSRFPFKAFSFSKLMICGASFWTKQGMGLLERLRTAFARRKPRKPKKYLVVSIPYLVLRRPKSDQKMSCLTLRIPSGISPAG